MDITDGTVFEGLALVIAAGGSSSRFGQSNKLFEELGGMPMFIWCIRSLSPCLQPGAVVMSVPEGQMDAFKDAAKWHLPEFEISFVEGGESRLLSVFNAVSSLPNDFKAVAVHDAARPFVTPGLLSSCVDACLKHGGAVAAKRVSDTIKEADGNGFAVKTLDRGRLWAMETPQVFPRDVLEDACRKAADAKMQFTDDAAAVQHFSGIQPLLVESRTLNMKITWPWDLELARSLLPSISRERK